MWYRRVHEEVDRAVEKHRSAPNQSVADVLATLTLDDWEADFPLIDLCLRETLRIHLTGTFPRKNTSGRNLSLKHTGETIPKDSFVVSDMVCLVISVICLAGDPSH